MFMQYSNQYNFNTILKSSKTDLAQNKSSQRVTLAAGVGSGEDRTPIELFIAGIRGWEADLRRHFPGKSGN